MHRGVGPHGNGGGKGLGVTRKTLSELVNGNSGISPEMAIRLSKAFGSSPEVWLGLQMDYDLALDAEDGRQDQGAEAFAGRLTGSACSISFASGIGG